LITKIYILNNRIKSLGQNKMVCGRLPNQEILYASYGEKMETQINAVKLQSPCITMNLNLESITFLDLVNPVHYTT
jgi:hypothetical protein